MAFSSLGQIGPLGGYVTPKASGTTQVLDWTALAFNAGEIVVVASAWDNAGTSEAITTQLSIADDIGTWVWVKIREYTMSSGAANDGTTLAVWYARATVQVSGPTVTITSSSARTAKASSAWLFDSDNAVAVEQIASDGIATEPVALTLTSMPSREYLLIHAGAEGRGSTWTADADYTAMFDCETTGGSATTNQNIWASYRIATLTGDTSDAASSTDTANAQILAAIYEVTAAAPKKTVLVTGRHG